MDTQSVELLEQQQQSLAGRKKLAELTRGICPHQDRSHAHVQYGLTAPTICYLLTRRCFLHATITDWSKTLLEFKKVPDQEKLQQFKLLLRAYQGEIDAITKREKTTAQAFLTVYNALGQAPDPAKLLQVAAVSLCSLVLITGRTVLVRPIVCMLRCFQNHPNG